MLKFALAVLATLTLAATPALAQTADDVNAQMQTLFGESKPFAEAFDAIKAAVANGDAEGLAELVSYPFRVSYDDEELVVENPAEFVANYDDIVTEDVAEAVAAQTYETLFVNADGVMFGTGELWMTAICEDDACKQSAVKVIAIQSTMQ